MTPVLLAAVCAGYAAGSALGWGGSRQLALVMGDFTLTATAVIAAAACLRQGLASDGRNRPAWLLFGASFTMAALGHLAAPLLPGFAAPAVVGLVLLARRPVSRAGRVCLGIDVWLVGGSLFVLYRSLATADAVQHAPSASARTLLDITLVSFALVLHFHRSGPGRPAAGTAAAALAAIGVGDLLVTTPFHDAAWFGGPLLVAYALRRSRRTDTAAAPPPRPGVRTGSRSTGAALLPLAPYLATAVGVLGILHDALDDGRVDRAALITCGSTVIGVVLRLGIMLLENMNLVQELARMENHFRALIQSSSDVIMIATPNGVLQYVSPASSGVYGRAAEELVGQELVALVHPEDAGLLVHEIRRFLDADALEEPTTRLECRFRTGDGSWVDVESTISRYQGGLIFNSRDVTPRVRLPARIGRPADPDLPPPAPGFAPSEPHADEGDTGNPSEADAPRENRAPAGAWGPGSLAKEPGGRVLHFGALLLPAEERSGWLEEQRAILYCLPGRREQWRWILKQLFAMPRFAYTVRSGRDKEPA
ncbi:PAS domain S-box protein [Streptomyces sp. WAC07061]|uniref:PAS domain-containing protein n=1 Tax=Streptomyces sp. WAC07061 TaxID=2487410 RepID=UPI000F7B9379|nr:PAS domain S-box protein [Streptomyces sp. WAC07061]RSS54699.1 PAS domain S-box protein [Streptomyces sp. WAC07061]